LFGTQGFNSPFSFFIFGKKQKYNNNKKWQSYHEVSSSSRYVLLFSYSGFCQHTQVPQSYQVMDVLSRVAVLQHY
jgi:hypothetical protein